MRIVPIQGLNLVNLNVICVEQQAYLVREIAELLEIPLSEEAVANDLWIERIYFIDHSQLHIHVPNEYENVKRKFPDTTTFALIGCRGSKWAEIYYLKMALSMIYIANRWKNEEYSSFFKQTLNLNAYFGKKGLESTIWDVRLGNSPPTANDWELTIPSYYTIDDLEDITRTPSWRYNALRVDANIQDVLEKLSIAIINRTRISDKLKSALGLLYTTFSFVNLDLVIPTYATILETLLLESNEDNQRKKVSVRAACLIANGKILSKKRYIANWVYHFYKYRNMIVHDGKSHVYIRLEEDILFNNAVNLVQHLIYFLIKEYTNANIATINEVKDIVAENRSQDELNNAFEYIDENLSLYYQELE